MYKYELYILTNNNESSINITFFNSNIWNNCR